MKFFTLNNLLSSNTCINKYKGIKNIFNNSIYKIVKNSCVINLTYTSIYVYKLYKIFYILHLNNVYATFIYTFKFYKNNFIKLLLKFTNNNIFYNKCWLKGSITNDYFLYNIFLLKLWIDKYYHTYNDKNIIIPLSVRKIKNKIKQFCLNLKFKRVSKFMFFFDLDKEKRIVKDCSIFNKFIMGICGYGRDAHFVDFFIYNNNSNEIFLNFIIKLIIIASINGKFSHKIKQF